MINAFKGDLLSFNAESDQFFFDDCHELKWG